MVGFVVNTKTNLPGATKLWKKIVLDNDNGEKVQVVGWDKLAKKLEAVDKVGMVSLFTSMRGFQNKWIIIYEF